MLPPRGLADFGAHSRESKAPSQRSEEDWVARPSEANQSQSYSWPFPPTAPATPTLSDSRAGSSAEALREEASPPLAVGHQPVVWTNLQTAKTLVTGTQ